MQGFDQARRTLLSSLSSRAILPSWMVRNFCLPHKSEVAKNNLLLMNLCIKFQLFISEGHICALSYVFASKNYCKRGRVCPWTRRLSIALHDAGKLKHVLNILAQGECEPAWSPRLINCLRSFLHAKTSCVSFAPVSALSCLQLFPEQTVPDAIPWSPVLKHLLIWLQSGTGILRGQR